jgi:hypothetical protein
MARIAGPLRFLTRSASLNRVLNPWRDQTPNGAGAEAGNRTRTVALDSMQRPACGHFVTNDAQRAPRHAVDVGKCSVGGGTRTLTPRAPALGEFLVKA